MAFRAALTNLSVEPETLAEAIDLADRFARMNHLLILGLKADLDAGIPSCLDDDLGMLEEVALNLHLRMTAVREFHEGKTEPPEEAPEPAGPNVVALSRRPGA